MNKEQALSFFNVNRWMLRCAGLWRPEIKNQYWQRLYTIYGIVVFLFVNLWFTATEFISIFYTMKNQFEFIKNINFFLTHFMGAIKVVFWYFYGDRLIGIMISLGTPGSLYEAYQAPPLSKQFLAECVYMLAMLFQLYLYCWFGNEVTLKFQELPQYIWENNWIATNTSFKKSMIFTMMRAKTPVYFTAGNFSRLTLATFMSVNLTYKLSFLEYTSLIADPKNVLFDFCFD
ncbi:hypothetical protein ABEB36_006641 [Hypothenemus hampei]|uniref:Uncharacterized protein n=1 Tax=Hypothenemus hampei TaxID=57062 RepID=A0ABD1ER90_HYPHA